MKHPLRVTAVPNEPIDLDRFVAALLALAMARVEAEQEVGEQEDEQEDEQERGGTR
jgi:GAF domain-containing protein